MKYVFHLFLFLSAATAFGEIPEGYYDSAAGKSDVALKNALHSIICGHTRISYDAVYDALCLTDKDPENSNNVILLYTGRSQQKEYQDHGSTYDYSQFGGVYNDAWNREHVWPKSHGFPDEADTAYTDIHHLRPADRTVNSSRGTLDFDDGGSQHSEAAECYYDSDSWEPRDDVKGDVARMVFYMTVRYSGSGDYDLEMADNTGTATYTPYLGKKSTLLSWHSADPPDSFEQARNETVYGIQGNRNPFIDHPEYAALIWDPSSAQLPAAPSGLAVSSVTETGASLAWTDNASDEDGFRIRLDGSLVQSVSSNTENAVLDGLNPGTTYSCTVTAWNGSGESAAASAEFTTQGSPVSVSGAVYISEYADASGTGNYIYEFVEIYNSGTAAADVSGTTLHQLNSSQDYAIPAETEIPGEGYLIIGRNAEQSAFESFWGVTLGVNTVYLNSGNSIPLINGDEQYRLEASDGTDIDPSGGTEDAFSYLPVSVNGRVYRTGTGNAVTDWMSGDYAGATPGSADNDQSLPVTLSRFWAVRPDRDVLLRWVTESETENAGFIIRRSSDGVPFEIIADYTTCPEIRGAGSVTDARSYYFTDRTAVSGNFTYELADVSFSGTETRHSDLIVQITDNDREDFRIDIQPNPVNGNARLSWEGFEGPVRITLTGLNGKSILLKTASDCRYETVISTDRIASGIYILTVGGKNRTASSKLIILK